MEIEKSRGRRPVWMTPFGQESWGDAFTDRPWLSWPRMAGEEYNPTLDLYEKDGSYVLTVELPGVEKDDIAISIADNVLTISGEKHFAGEQQGKRYYIRESSGGSFSRSFRLPKKIEEGNVEATFKDGVLRLVIPHKAEDGARKIEING